MYGEAGDGASGSSSRSPMPRREGAKVVNKMPQSFRLSRESEELRRALRQDVLDVMTMGSLGGHWHEAAAPWGSARGTPGRVCASSVGGVCTPPLQTESEPFAWPSDGLREEVSRLREAVDRLTSHLPAADGAVASFVPEAARPRADVLEVSAPAQPAEGKALVHYEQGRIEKANGQSCGATDKVVEPDGARFVPEGHGGDAAAADRIPPAEEQRHSLTSVNFPDPVPSSAPATERSTATLAPLDVCWEWQRTNKGWARYPPSEIKRIELAFRTGVSRVRLKSGKEGKTPMEIFFVDMVQLDPTSGNKRSIRRTGLLPWWMQVLRNVRALRRQVATGEPRWETLEQYNLRQKEFTSAGSVDTMWMSVARSTSGLAETVSEIVPVPGIRRRLGQVARSSSFAVMSILVTILQVVWVAIDTDRNHNVNVWDKPPFDQAVDLSFLMYFAIDLIMVSCTFKSLRACFSSLPWCFDAICVSGSTLEVLIFPALAVLFDRRRDWAGFGALRALRLAKVARIWRVLTCSSDATPFFKGLLFGVRSAGFIWAIILAMTYVFAVLMRLYADDAIRDVYDEFNYLDTTFLLLIVRGLMMDEVGVLMLDLWRQDKTSWLIFTIYTWFTFFSLLNMLVGTFCTVAGDVSAAEKDSADMAYLKHHLSSIVECYVHHGLIGRNEFDLIMKNVDVSRICSQRGTDLSELDALKATLFHDQDHIEFNTFFQAITHLRKGKLATVKDIMQMQDTLSDKMDRLGRTVRESRSEPRGDASASWQPSLSK